MVCQVTHASAFGFANDFGNDYIGNDSDCHDQYRDTEWVHASENWR